MTLAKNPLHGAAGFFVVAGNLFQGDASPLIALRHGADHQTRPAAGGLSWPCRMVGDVADPPAGGATPRHSRARRGIGPRPATRARPLRAASKLRPRTGRAQRARTPPRGSAAGRRSGAGPLRRAGQAEAEPHQRRQRRRRASAGRLAGAWPARAGGPHRPKSPHEWGRGGPEHRRRDRRGGGAGQGRAERAPEGGLALRRGEVPPSNGWRLASPAGARPEPPKAATSRHITPTAAGGRGGRRPSRPGWAGVAARRPLGAGGTRPEGADGSPHQPAGLASPCLAVSSTKPRGRRVGRAGPRPGPFTARPKGRAQTEAATRPRPGARAEDPRSAPPRGDPAPRGRKKARPSGRAICYLEPYRAAGREVVSQPPPPLCKVRFIGQCQPSRGDNTGAAAPVPQRGYTPSHDRRV